jgi:hypothetical protein
VQVMNDETNGNCLVLNFCSDIMTGTYCFKTASGMTFCGTLVLTVVDPTTIEFQGSGPGHLLQGGFSTAPTRNRGNARLFTGATTFTIRDNDLTVGTCSCVCPP